ncbi:MAG: immunoglobulin domain-containing protein [Bacteroidetes bacterium]|nr:immunoglobulin domain-containing protein [Bacteroidota bacterium]
MLLLLGINSKTLAQCVAPSITTQPTATAVCAGSNASFTVAASGTAVLNYQWQANSGSGFTNLTNTGVYSNVTTTTLNITGATAGLSGTNYRCFVTNGCGNATSLAPSLTVNTAPVMNQLMSNQITCAGSNASFFFNSSASNPTFAWEVNSGSGWGPVVNGGVYSGATTNTLLITGATAALDGSNFRCTISGTCPSPVLSNAPSLTVKTLPIVNANPLNVTACVGDAAAFTVNASASGITYQWQVSSGGPFTNLNNTFPYSGVNGATLNIVSAAIGLNNNQYRCVIGGDCSPTATSGAATLTLNSAPSIITQPSNTNVCENTGSSFSVTASGAGLLYQWQIFSGSSWVNLTSTFPYSGTNGATMSLVSTPLGFNGNQYRCVVSGTCAPPTISNSAVLTVRQTLTITSQPTSATICVTNNASFSVGVTGNLVAYQWQINNGSGFANATNSLIISGATTSTLTFTNPPATLSGSTIRCYITGDCSTPIQTVNATLTVNVPPAFGTHPSNVAICPGSNTTFAVTATGSNLVYQWQANSGSGYANLTNTGVYSNVGTATLQITGATAAMHGTDYRCVITGSCNPGITSNNGTLSIKTVPSVATSPSNTTVCSGSTASFTVSGSATGILYQWQVNSGSGFTNISNSFPYSGANGATVNVVSTTAAMNNNQFRCVITGDCGSPATSGAATLTVNTAPSVVTSPSNVTVCENVNSSFSVSATGTSLTYQWQSYNGTTWVNVPASFPYSGTNSNTLTIINTPASLNSSQFRCEVSGTCTPPALSGVASLTVNTNPVITSNPSSVSTCNSVTAFTVAATGFNLTYSWQAFVSGSWTVLTNTGIYSGVSTPTLTLSGFTSSVSGTQYRCVVSGGCGPIATSSAATLTVFTIPVIAVQPISTSTCAGSNASFTVNANGSGLNYQWQENNGTGFSNLGNAGVYSGTSTATLTITGATTTMNNYSYRCVINGTCTPPAILTNNVTLTVNGLPTITSSPSATTVCAGTNASFTVAANGGGLLYQWQVDNGTGYSNLTSTFPYSGINGSTLTITTPTTALNGFSYRCVVSGTCTPSVTSAGALLTVNGLPTVTSQPSNVTICAGANTSFTVGATGTGLTYQWQVNSGAGYSNLVASAIYSNVNTTTLNLTGTPASLNGSTYRCIVSGTCSPQAQTINAILTVNTAPVINSQPLAATVCNGTNATFSVFASGTALTYQWQENNGSGFANIAAATNPSVTLSAVTAGMSGYTYRCVINGTCGTITTNTVSLTVNISPAITSNPALTTVVCQNTTATFSVGATGTNLTYQWQVNTGSGFTNLSNVTPYSGANGATLTIINTPTSFNNYVYRCVINGICTPSVTSGSSTLNVNAMPVLVTQPSSSTVCAGTNTAFTVIATGSGLAYQWQANSGSGFANLANGGVYSGATSASLVLTAPPASMHGMTYRCIITGTCNPTLQTVNVVLTVNTPPSVIANPSDVTVCEAAPATFYVNASGRGNFTYQWQSSPDNSSWTNMTEGGIVGGSKTATLVIGHAPYSLNGYFYRCVLTTSCGALNSNSAKLTVDQGPVIVQQPINDTTCEGTTAFFSVTATGLNLTYQWQTNNGSGWANVLASTGPTFEIQNVNYGMNGMNVRCVLNGSCAATVYTSIVSLLVDRAPSISGQPLDFRMPYGTGQIATFSVFALGSGTLTYQWQMDSSTTVGVFYVNLVNNGMFSGVNTSTLTITNPSSNLQAKHFRCMVSGLCTPPTYSKYGTLTLFFPNAVGNINAENTEVKIYPNPASGDNINITVGKSIDKEISVRVVNDMGSLVYNQVVSLDNSNTGTIDIRNLAAGVYSLQVTDKNQTTLQTIRFVKQ